MPLKTEKPGKLYYSIKEVAQMLDVSESLLRYWETELPKDIEQIKVVYNLVKVRGHKLSAARKMLNMNRTGVDRSAEIQNTLIAVRDELKELKKQVDMLV